jgi:hypothetical protein
MTVFPPLAAATDVAALLGDLFVILLAAKIGDGLFERIQAPARWGRATRRRATGMVPRGEVGIIVASIGQWRRRRPAVRGRRRDVDPDDADRAAVPAAAGAAGGR